MKHIPKLNSKSIIERNDTIQVETNLTTGDVLKARIRWTSNCEYELFYISNSKDSISTYIKTHALKNVILQSNEDYYIAKSTFEGLTITLIDTVRVVK